MEPRDPSRLMEHAAALAAAHAPFLRALLRHHPGLPTRLAEAGLETVLGEAAAASAADPDVAVALRRERQQVALAVALADLAGTPLESVTASLTRFADRALDRAIAAAVAERYDAPPRGFVALALGKQGSCELNYSSDIDPILLFDPEIMPRHAREEPVEAAVRIARRVVALLQDRTGDGYVLRVDLRLRPASEATPLAVPLDLAIQHYESSALPWERAAFIRARACAGDVALGQRFLDHIRPFVWRRALDFGAVQELRALTHRIRAHRAQHQAVGPGYDLKRGRGGIREIEFFAQIHQLIHGGRQPALRAPATLDALAALADADVIGREDAGVLADAYRTLRTIEHRLQMVDDQQTHRLPADTDALANVAAFSGMDSTDALLDRLRAIATAVGERYDALEGDARDQTIPAEFGAFADREGARRIVGAWREGSVRTTRGAAARDALEGVLPPLLDALASAPAPDAALSRLDDLIARLPSAINLFRLLRARPALIGQLVAVLSHAPALSHALAKRADLLDGLIDTRQWEDTPSTVQLAAALRRGEAGDDYQALLDRVRREVGERRFGLGVRLIARGADPLATGVGYARLAEAALEVLAAAAAAEFARAHGHVPGGELVVLALGRFGGGVLTDASDLDLIYLFTGDFLADSDGARPLGATVYFQRLAQRVTAALSVPTAAGPLYSVDTRLRPSGNQGLLAVSIDSFDRYERESAWTWEHMALTRARAVFGSAAARAQAEGVVAHALRRPRDPARLRADALRMRGDIATHKPAAGPLDVKLIDGGLVDAEFTVHVLQLGAGIALTPDIATAIEALAAAGLIDAGFGPAVALLTRMLITLRLVAPGGGEPADPSRALVAGCCGAADWDALMARYADARALIAAEWRRVAGLG